MKLSFVADHGKDVNNFNMKTIHATYEKGVFRPTDRVELPEHCKVEFEPRLVATSVDEGKEFNGLYAILSERYASGESDVAARHDEHQP